MSSKDLLLLNLKRMIWDIKGLLYGVYPIWAI